MLKPLEPKTFTVELVGEQFVIRQLLTQDVAKAVDALPGPEGDTPKSIEAAMTLFASLVIQREEKESEILEWLKSLPIEEYPKIREALNEATTVDNKKK